MKLSIAEHWLSCCTNLDNRKHQKTSIVKWGEQFAGLEVLQL